ATRTAALPRYLTSMGTFAAALKPAFTLSKYRGARKPRYRRECPGPVRLLKIGGEPPRGTEFLPLPTVLGFRALWSLRQVASGVRLIRRSESIFPPCTSIAPCPSDPVNILPCTHTQRRVG